MLRFKTYQRASTSHFIWLLQSFLKITLIIFIFDLLQFSAPIIFLTKKISVLCLKTCDGIHLPFKRLLLGFPGGTSSREPVCQCRRHKRCKFDSWVGKIPWRRTWHPTPVFLPGESPWTRSWAGYSPQGHKESDTTEAT